MAIQLIKNFKSPNSNIIQFPDEGLRQVSEKVTKFDSEILEIVEKLQQILLKVDRPYKLWLGMAAPQIGYNKRIIVLKIDHRKSLIMINPEIIELKWLLPIITGCYSLKGLYLRKSHYWYKVKYQDEAGKYHQGIFKGGTAVALEQELDHINGKLACD